MQQTTQFEPLPGDKTRLRLNIRPADDQAGGFTKSICWLFAAYEKFVFARLLQRVNSSI